MKKPHRDNLQDPVDWILLPEETPMTEGEHDACASGFRFVAGADEAGRGPLAGPIVAAAVILGEVVPGVNDSKLLTERRREALFAQLMDGPHRIGLTVIEPGEIDETGIQRANYRALSESALQTQADFVLVDGFQIPGFATPHRKMVKGDRRSQSIAAASIVAKVTRDRIMAALDERYPEYGFSAHKGYGTRRHLEALDVHGPCPAHRRSFAPIANHPETAALFNKEGIGA
jgi:ribonuclease HII